MECQCADNHPTFFSTGTAPSSTMSMHISSYSSMSRMMAPSNLPPTLSSSVSKLELDGFDDFNNLHQPVHPVVAQPPPPPSAASCTAQNMLLQPSSAPFPSSPPPLRLKSRYATIPLPELPDLEGDNIIHYTLRSSPTPTLLDWDVRTDPFTARPELNNRSFAVPPHLDQHPLQWLNQPASTPSLDRIFIYTDLVPSHWIVAEPSDCRSRVVTVYDVLLAVHRAVRELVPKRKARSELSAPRFESGDPKRRRWGAGPDRRAASWSEWKWGGLVPRANGGWKLILK